MTKKKLQGVVFIIGLFSWSLLYAAQEVTLDGDADHYAELLNKFLFHYNKDPHNNKDKSIPRGLRLPDDLNTQKDSVNKLEFQEGHIDSLHQSHVRYNQSYHGLSVLGAQIIYHIGFNKKITVTGALIDNIEQDIPSINEGISVSQAKQIALGKNVALDTIAAEKVVFYDESISTKAILAYQISYSAKGPSLPVYIIDANTGVIIKQSDGYMTAGS